MTHKETDPEGDGADSASLEDADETCTYCGQPLAGLDGCSTPGCEGNPEYDPDLDDTDDDDIQPEVGNA